MHASRLHVQVCATGMLGNISIYTGIFEQNLPLPMGQLQEGSIQLRDCFQARGQRGTKQNRVLSPPLQLVWVTQAGVFKVQQPSCHVIRRSHKIVQLHISMQDPMLSQQDEWLL